jgi:hypothetical protein
MGGLDRVVWRFAPVEDANPSPDSTARSPDAFATDERGECGELVVAGCTASLAAQKAAPSLLRPGCRLRVEWRGRVGALHPREDTWRLSAPQRRIAPGALCCGRPVPDVTAPWSLRWSPPVPGRCTVEALAGRSRGARTGVPLVRKASSATANCPRHGPSPGCRSEPAPP